MFEWYSLLLLSGIQAPWLLLNLIMSSNLLPQLTASQSPPRPILPTWHLWKFEKDPIIQPVQITSPLSLNLQEGDPSAPAVPTWRQIFQLWWKHVKYAHYFTQKLRLTQLVKTIREAFLKTQLLFIRWAQYIQLEFSCIQLWKKQ